MSIFRRPLQSILGIKPAATPNPSPSSVQSKPAPAAGIGGGTETITNPTFATLYSGTNLTGTSWPLTGSMIQTSPSSAFTSQFPYGIITMNKKSFTGTRSWFGPASVTLTPGTVLQIFKDLNTISGATTNISMIAGFRPPVITLVAGNSTTSFTDLSVDFPGWGNNWGSGFILIPPPSYQLSGATGATGTIGPLQVSYPVPSSGQSYAGILSGGQFTYSGACYSGDWEANPSGSSNTHCVSANYYACPQFGGAGPLRGFGYTTNYDTSAYNNDANVTLNCSYDLSQFQTYQDLNNLYNYSWSNASQVQSLYNTVVMPSICVQPTSNCPTDLVSGAEMPSCSTFVMQGNDTLGTACQEWITQARAPGSTIGSAQVDATMQNYCQNNLGATGTYPQDCRCLYPTQVSPADTSYTTGNSALVSTNPGLTLNCWYVPCEAQSIDTYLITSAIADNPCPSTVCVANQYYSTISAQTSGTVNIGQTTVQQNCTSTSNTVTPNSSTGTPPSPSSSSSSKTWIYIIIGIIILLLIVGGAIGAFFLLKKK
jgi:hypothetical protein